MMLRGGRAVTHILEPGDAANVLREIVELMAGVW